MKRMFSEMCDQVLEIVMWMGSFPGSVIKDTRRADFEDRLRAGKSIEFFLLEQFEELLL